VVVNRAVKVSVRLPAGVPVRRAVTWVNRKRVSHTRRGGLVTFRLPASRAGAPVDWAVTRAKAKPGPKRHRTPATRGSGPNFTG
jgi:hypothetical protein